MNDYRVILSDQARKDLDKIPFYIARKLLGWIDDVMLRGLYHVQKIPGYHDEALKGNRKGQRSIRLNKAYRALYFIDENEKINFITIVGINKHEY